MFLANFNAMTAMCGASTRVVWPFDRRHGPRGHLDAEDVEISLSIPANSETALVCFGAMGRARSVFNFFRLLKPLPHLTKILLRDPARSWYNDSIPGFGETIPEIAASIRSEVSRLGATRIITLGPSMGGYAAILFGCLLKADRAIALAPQTLLDPIFFHSPPPSLKLQAPDLRPYIECAPEIPIDVVAGWDDPLDVFHAQRVAEFASVRILALPGRTHWLSAELHAEGKLVSLITELVHGTTPADCTIDPQLDGEVERRIARTVFALEAEAWPSAADNIVTVATCHPAWVGPHFALAEALAKITTWTCVQRRQLAAVARNPAWGEPRSYLIRDLLVQGRRLDLETLDAIK